MRNFRKTICRLLLMAAMIFFLPAGWTRVWAESNTETTGSGDASDPYVVYNWSELKHYLAGGENYAHIRLGEDITCTSPTSYNYLYVPAYKHLYLDLAGYTIDRGLSKKEAIQNGYVLRVDGNLDVTSTAFDSNNEYVNGCITGGNNTQNGGGIYLSRASVLTIERAAITGNQALNGGGMYVESAVNTLHCSRNTMISNNVAAEQGGGLYLGPGASCVLEQYGYNGCFVEQNKAKMGGGVYVGDAASLVLTSGSYLSNNITDSDSIDSAFSDGFVSDRAMIKLGYGTDCGKVYMQSGSELEIDEKKTKGSLYMEGKAGIVCAAAASDGAGVQNREYSEYNLTLAPDYCGYIRTSTDMSRDQLPLLKDENGNSLDHSLVCLNIDENREKNAGIVQTVYFFKEAKCKLQFNEVTNIYNDPNGTLTGFSTSSKANEGQHYDVGALFGVPEGSTETEFTLYAEWAKNSPQQPYRLTEWGEVNSAISHDGYFRLEEDLSPKYSRDPFTVPENTTVVLDLNGHIIDHGYSQKNWTNNGFIFRVENGGKLILRDSRPDQDHGNKFTYRQPYTKQSVSATGGIITGGFGVSDGGGVYVCEGGTFTMEGGTIFGNHTRGNGGAVYVCSGGHFTMKDGALINNSSGKNGGGVYADEDSAFAMAGGLICGNTASVSGGGIGFTGAFSVSGNTVVLDNHKGTDQYAADYENNVYLSTGSKVSVSAPLTAYDAKTLTGSLIGVTAQSAPTADQGVDLTTGLGGETTDPRGNASNFRSDNKAFKVALSAAGEAVLKLKINGEDESEEAVVTQVPVANDLTCTGSEQELVTPGEGDGGTMMYAIGSNETTEPAGNAYTSSVPKAIDAGTYYVWYMVAGDSEHYDSAAGCVSVTIKKAPDSDPGQGDQGQGGKEQGGKEQGDKEQGGKEQGGKEQGGKEQGGKQGQEGGDQGAKDPSGDQAKGIVKPGIGTISADGKTLTDEDGVTYRIMETISADELTNGLPIADQKSGGKYRITKIVVKKGKDGSEQVKSGTVEYVAPYDKNTTKIKTLASIRILGASFKVTSIGKRCGKGCEKLKTVIVGTNVTKIGKSAFSGCKNLKKIQIKAKKLKKVSSGAFKGIHKKAVIKVPSAKLAKYKKLLKGKGQGKGVKITK